MNRSSPTIASLARQAGLAALVLLAWPGGPASAAEKPDAAPKPTHAGVHYGDQGGQELDAWIPAGAGAPAAVVVYIHGGSWERGSRTSVAANGLARYLAAGIAVVSIDYRFVAAAERAGVQPPVRWPLEDAARAVQFVRRQAASWGIDAQRLGLSGGSAGACSALWLALHDDLAQPGSSDPVARQSTRPLCAGVRVAQTTLDPRQMREWFKSYPTYGAHAFGFHKHGGDDEAVYRQLEAAREQVLPWIQEYSPIAHATRDDPPLYLAYDRKPPGDSVHGAMYGLKLKETMDALGVPCQVGHPGATAASDASEVDFLLRMLRMPAGIPAAAGR
jgi:acetyl esterase/lipase